MCYAAATKRGGHKGDGGVVWWVIGGSWDEAVVGGLTRGKGKASKGFFNDATERKTK